MTTLEFFEKELELFDKKYPKLEEGNNYGFENYIPELKSIFKKFDDERHSGFSAGFTRSKLVNILEKVLNFEPFFEIENENEFDFEEESKLQCFKGLVQSKRISSVFKDLQKENKPYYIYAVIFREHYPDGHTSCFTSSSSLTEVSSSQFIKYPFIPKSFYIDVKKENDKYEIMFPNQLQEVKSYYDCENSRFFNFEGD